jgi:hypothetical protein
MTTMEMTMVATMTAAVNVEDAVAATDIIVVEAD